jgi:hypothetical protein
MRPLLPNNGAKTVAPERTSADATAASVCVPRAVGVIEPTMFVNLRNGCGNEVGADSVRQRFGAIAQLAERLHGMEEVKGSIPFSSTPKPRVDRLGFLRVMRSMAI